MRKVSLREIVADKIVFAILIALTTGCGQEMTGITTIHQFNTLSLPLPSSILSPAHPALRNTNRNCRMKCLRPT